MRRNIAIVIAVLVVVGGLAWERPLPALSALGAVMTALGIPALYGNFLDWIAAHPELTIDLAPWVMMGVGFAALFYLLAWPPIWARLRYRPLQILFDENDQSHRFIRTTQGVTRFYVGLYNARTDGKTIQFVSLRAHEGEFAKEILSRAHQRPTSENDPILEQPFMLDAGATHYVELFGINDFGTSDTEPKVNDSVVNPMLKRKHSFTLDARGRDVQTEFATFEFDPKASPMLRKVKSPRKIA